MPKLPRFTWNSPRNGRILYRYIDTMCDKFPAIARAVVKHGIGDLNSWFSKKNGMSADAKNATCGCLIGTTCLVAMKRFPSAGKAAVAHERDDGARLLYRLIVERTGRDISKYTEPDYHQSIRDIDDPREKEENRAFDPLLVCIHQAGIAASDEASPSGAEWDALYDSPDLDPSDLRQKQVVDRLEWRIRQRLGLLPKDRKSTKARRRASR